MNDLTCDLCEATATSRGVPFTPQSLGMHKYHQHGVKSAEPRGHKRKPLAPIVGEDVVTIVLEQMFPNGIPVTKIGAVMRWQEATIQFMKEVS